jgi:hypothetical protein
MINQFIELFECLIVFTIFFFAGSLWPFLLRRCVEYLMEESAYA